LAENSVNAEDTPSILTRHEFLLRRLHSLTGLIPVGAYMCVHLVTNASVLDGPGTFQENVYTIHSLGSALLFVEWAFIFLPILFHGILGLLIVSAGKSNTRLYPLQGNIRYTLQRSTGVIAFVFIMVHVFHMHGWFHAHWWIEYVARPLGGKQFYPYSASSTAADALASPWWIAFYAVGILACVYHLANGIWTMGVTWGIWTRPASQLRASAVCAIFGVGLAAVGLAALFGMATVDGDEAREFEKRQYNERVRMGVILENEEKRAPKKDETSQAGTDASVFNQ
jgi:succinate dehydrogenase / fumarate reductase cytochrome b subunit